MTSHQASIFNASHVPIKTSLTTPVNSSFKPTMTVLKTMNVQFQVHLNGDETPSNDDPNQVWLVGSSQQLGDWIPAKATPMKRVVKNHSNGCHANGLEGMTWAADISLPPNESIQYRYFIGQHSPLVPNKVIVAKWEAFIAPRSYVTKESKDVTVVKDTFGRSNQSSNMDIGWLTTQMEVRLSFLKNPIRWWKKRHQTQRYAMKVKATDPKGTTETLLDASPSVDSLNDYALLHEEHEGTLGPVKYAVLTDPKKNKTVGGDGANIKGYRKQDQFGVPLSVDENLIFKVQTEDPRNLYFTIDFFVLDHPKSLENAPYYAGSSHILYTNFTSEDSQITAPIFGRNSCPIGQVTFNYLVIRPLQTTTLDMSRSRFFHWEQGSGPKEVGHRGMGTSYNNFNRDGKPSTRSNIRENTIRAMVEAGRCGADFVECDVQLTKDRVPVIYHDFNLKVNLRKRVLNNMDDMRDSNFELCNMAVKDLTLRQLQSLQTYHSSVEEFGSRDWRTDPTAANSDEPEDLLPFPMLEKLLTTLDVHVGVNVEIKYPQFIDHGEDGLEHEQLHFFDRNDYLDTILETLLKFSGERHVIISCFDSDACVMLKKKQNRFPVLFLTQGQSLKYPPYKDFRTLSIPAAIKFACAEHLVGINVHTEDLLREAALVSETKRAGLLIFCWGEDNNNHDNIRYLKSHGVDGIICDRIHEFISPGKASKANGTKRPKLGNGDCEGHIANNETAVNGNHSSSNSH